MRWCSSLSHTALQCSGDPQGKTLTHPLLWILHKHEKINYSSSNNNLDGLHSMIILELALSSEWVSGSVLVASLVTDGNCHYPIRFLLRWGKTLHPWVGDFHYMLLRYTHNALKYLHVTHHWLVKGSKINSAIISSYTGSPLTTYSDNSFFCIPYLVSAPKLYRVTRTLGRLW